MKCQINSKEALERLINGDEEFEITIKNTILNEITGKYLKSIAHDKIMSEISKSVSGIISQFDYDGLIKRVTYNTFTGTSKLKELVNKMVNEGFREIIDEEINKQMTDIRQKINDELNQAVNVTVGRISEYNINRLVKERITKLLNQE